VRRTDIRRSDFEMQRNAEAWVFYVVIKI
jgi:hypothetical protein